MNRRLSLFVLAAILSVSSWSSAQTPATDTNEPTVGMISGSVVSESGQPLPGAVVYVRELNSMTVARSSITDAEGNFKINGLASALYSVSASLPAYVNDPLEPFSPSRYYRIGDSVKIEMVRGGVITGTVTNSAGEPVIGVRVRVALARDAKGQTAKMSSVMFSERSTDDRGVYRVFGLAPGRYLVFAGGSGMAPNFQLNPYDTDVPTYAPSSTRDTATEVTVRGGEESTVDIRYRGEPGHIISGTLKGSGSTGASISLNPVGSNVSGPVSVTVQVPGSRGFAFSGIADGEYDLIAQEVATVSMTLTIPELMYSEPRRVIVKGADVTGIELVTKPLASISGRIVLEPAKVPECQNKRRPLFAEMLVTLQRPEKETEKDVGPFMRLIPGSASPDAKGDFVARNLSPGRYLFDPRFYARYWYLDSISIASTPKTDATANWTTLKSGDRIANLTITLAEGAASIRGRVTGAAEIPSGLGVYLVPADREKATDVLRFFVAAVEADGTFAFNNVPPGRYRSLLQTVDAQTGTTAKLRLPEAAEARTKLRRAVETQKTDLELKPCQNLTDVQLKL